MGQPRLRAEFASMTSGIRRRDELDARACKPGSAPSTAAEALAAGRG